MKRITIKKFWEGINKPFWTPLGLMGWMAWVGWLYTDGIEGRIYGVAWMFAMVCWLWRGAKENPPKK